MTRSIGVTTLFLAAALGGCGGDNGGSTLPPPPGNTKPTVTSSVPANHAVSVAINSAVIATFSKAMDPASITTATFTVTAPGGAVVLGTVTYTGGAAMFQPTSVLAANTLLNVTVNTGTKDVAGDALAANYTFSFTTGAIADTTPPVVASTLPTDGAISVATNGAVTATFSEALTPATVTTATFKVTAPGAVAVPGTVTYAGLVATFHPASVLAVSTLFTATINTGVKDLAGNALVANRVWSFTTDAVAHVRLSPVLLGAAGTFAILSKSGITDVPPSVVTGDVGTSPISGAALLLTCTEVKGKFYVVDATGPGPCATNDAPFLTTAIGDMLAAYTDAAGRPTPDFVELGAGDLSGLTLAPGLYTWGGTVTIPTDVTLSGGPNDVWIFQISQNLTMSSAKNVFLSGGAQAKNVFWQVAGEVTLGTTAHFEGIILSQTAIKLRTGASVNGRLLAQMAVTLDSATVTHPAP